MPESDESAPHSPRVPEGTDLLKVQLKVRAAQIAQSLGVDQLASGTTSTEQDVTEVPGQTSEEASDEADCEITFDSSQEVPVNQNGAELVIHGGRPYPPNHELLRNFDVGQNLWLESLQALKQTSPGKSSPPAAKEEKKEKPNKVKIKVQDSAEPEEDRAAKHKLVRVKVQRVGTNKIILKQTQDCGKGRETQDIVIREIELPTRPDGESKTFDAEWLSSVLAEEAVKLASKAEEALSSQPKKKKSKGDKKKSEKPQEDDVSWAVVTISDNDEEEAEKEEEDIFDTSDIEDTDEALARDTQTKGLNDPITIKKQTVQVPEALMERKKKSADGTEMLTLTTRDIREEAPHLMEYIKDAGLARAIYQKLQQERESLRDKVKDSDYVASRIQNEKEQKLCLQRALQSEKSMLQDDVMFKRGRANDLALKAGDFISKTTLLEKRRHHLETTVKTCKDILDAVTSTGFLRVHQNSSAAGRLAHIWSKIQDIKMATSVEESDSNRATDQSQQSNGEPSPPVQQVSQEVDNTLPNTVKTPVSRPQDMGVSVPPGTTVISSTTAAQVTVPSIKAPTTQAGTSQQMVTLQPMSSPVVTLPHITQPVQALVSSKFAKGIAAGGTFTLEQLQAAGIKIRSGTSPIKLARLPLPVSMPAVSVARSLDVKQVSPITGKPVSTNVQHQASSTSPVQNTAVFMSSTVGKPGSSDVQLLASSKSPVQNTPVFLSSTAGKPVSSDLQLQATCSSAPPDPTIMPIVQGSSSVPLLSLSKPITEALRDMILSKKFTPVPSVSLLMSTSAPQQLHTTTTAGKPTEPAQVLLSSQPQSSSHVHVPVTSPLQGIAPGNIRSMGPVTNVPLITASLQGVPLTGAVRSFVPAASVQNLGQSDLVQAAVSQPTRLVLSNSFVQTVANSNTAPTNVVQLRMPSPVVLSSDAIKGLSTNIQSVTQTTPLVRPAGPKPTLNATLLQPQSTTTSIGRPLLQNIRLPGSLASNSSVRLVPIQQPPAQTRLPAARGVRVQMMSGQPCSLPQLPSSVLRAIGPNDQVVVLSAGQLQQLQGPSINPLQLASTATNLSTMGAAVSLLPIAPKPMTVPTKAPKQKVKKKYAKTKRIKYHFQNDLTEQKSKDDSEVEVQNSLPMVNNNDLPQIVQEMITEESPSNLLDPIQNIREIAPKPSVSPMDTFGSVIENPTEIPGVESAELQEAADLVQLAMEDCNIPVTDIVTEQSEEVTIYNPDNPQVVQDLDYAQMDSLQDVISCEVVASSEMETLPSEYTQADGAVGEAVTVEMINTTDTVDMHEFADVPLNFNNKTPTSIEAEILEGYENVTMDDKNCCEFDQFLDDKRDKEVYSQEVYSQSSQGSSDVIQQHIEFDLL